MGVDRLFRFAIRLRNGHVDVRAFFRLQVGEVPISIRVFGKLLRVQIDLIAGIDGSQHLSQFVSGRMLEESTVVLTMTERHRQVLRDMRPDLSERFHLISRSGRDVSDPIGGTLDEYRDCLAEITNNLRLWVQELFTKDCLSS